MLCNILIQGFNCFISAYESSTDSDIDVANSEYSENTSSVLSNLSSSPSYSPSSSHVSEECLYSDNKIIDTGIRHFLCMKKFITMTQKSLRTMPDKNNFTFLEQKIYLKLLRHCHVLCVLLKPLTIDAMASDWDTCEERMADILDSHKEWFNKKGENFLHMLQTHSSKLFIELAENVCLLPNAINDISHSEY